MKVGTKEFEELQCQFEADIKKEIYGHQVEREGMGSTAPAGYFYTDGLINKLFRAYMLGYENAQCLARLGC